MDEGITFDQFHKWLERRLGGEPELSIEKKTAVAASSIIAQPRRFNRAF